MKPRTIVYVDGFNFYYGAVRGTPHKWHDLEKCFLKLRPADDILKQIKCVVPGCPYPGARIFDVPEEKRTDVNIALQLLNDANHDRADQFIIVSGDSDLVPALEMVKTQWPAKRLVVYVPSRHPLRGAAVELRSAADKHRTFPQALLKVCQFPPELPDGRGGTIRKPDRW